LAEIEVEARPIFPRELCTAARVRIAERSWLPLVASHSANILAGGPRIGFHSRLDIMRGFLTAIFLSGACFALHAAETRPLDLYWVDVEGGAGTLIVTPAGESIVIDT